MLIIIILVFLYKCIYGYKQVDNDDDKKLALYSLQLNRAPSPDDGGRRWLLSSCSVGWRCLSHALRVRVSSPVLFGL